MLEEVPTEDRRRRRQPQQAEAGEAQGQGRRDLGRRRLRVLLRRVPRRGLPPAAAAGSQGTAADREHALLEELAGRPPDVAAEPADDRRDAARNRRRDHRQHRRRRLPGRVGRTRSRRSATGTITDVEKALEHVQTFDPIGVGARDLQECLLLQIRHLGLAGTPAETLVRDHLPLLQNHQIPELAKQLGIEPEEIKAHIEFIKHLDPKPGVALQPGRVAVRHPGRLHHQDRRGLPRRAERRRPAAAAHQPGLPAAARQGRRDVGRDARLREGQVPVGAVAAEVGRPAAEDDRQGRDEHHQLPARVPRPRHRAPAAAGAARRRQRHRHARVHGLARGQQQVHAHAAGRVRDEVLLPQRHQQLVSARASRRSRSSSASRRSSRPRTSGGRSATRRS